MKVSKFIGFIFCFLILGTISCEKGPRKALITTEFGDITIELYDQTPRHRDNFVKLVDEGFYDGTLFHRVMPAFMIQGGDPESIDSPSGAPLGKGGPGYQLEHEIGAPHLYGTVAAARTPNKEKKSSGSQFYITVGQKVTEQQLDYIEKKKGIKYNQTQRKLYKEIGGYPSLDNDYTVFGEVIEGMDAVEKIINQPKDSRNRPLTDIPMKIKMIN